MNARRPVQVRLVGFIELIFGQWRRIKGEEREDEKVDERKRGWGCTNRLRWYVGTGYGR